jgi:hypothetical protein
VDCKDNVLLRGSWGKAGLWIITEHPVRTISNTHIALQAKDDLDQADQLLAWHRRLGHADMKKVWGLGQAGKLDGKAWEFSFRRLECIGCLQGKAARENSSINPDRASKPLINVSVDLWGPATTPSRLGHYYFLTCYDDYSHYIYISPLQTKDQALNALIEYVNLAENQLDRNVKTIRSDQGGEFKSAAMKEWCAKKGIEHDYTPTAAHNQNSRVERVHLNLMNDVRTALADSGLDKTFWVDALRYAVYTRNRLPTAKGDIPYLLFKAENQHQAVDYSHLRGFGSWCVYRIHRQESKLDSRGARGRMIGYGMGATSYDILTED